MRPTGLGLALLCALAASACQTSARAGDPVVSAAGAPVPSKAESESRIFERQQIMTQLDEDADTLGDVVSGTLPKSKLGPVTRSIANGAKEARASFATPLPGGRSKAEVWSSHADFMQRMDVFVVETEAMAKLGEAGNVAGVTDKLITALPCKECHDTYREPKKSKT